MPRLLVSGATGNVGGACARFLLANRAAATTVVRCMVRDPAADKARALQEIGAEVMQGDFGDGPSIERALEGVDAALLACANSPEQVQLEQNFIAAAARHGVYIVKLSTCGCEGYCDEDSKIEYGRWHAQIEATLEQSTAKWTILQPNCFFQNHFGDIFGGLPHRTLAYPRTAAQVDGGRARTVDTTDVGEIAAKLLLLDDSAVHHGKRYHVCGPKGWSVRGLADMYEAALTLPPGTIKCVTPSEAEYAESLERHANFPRWQAVAVAHSQSAFWAESKLDYPSSDAVLALHPTFRTMEEWFAAHAHLAPPPAQP